MENPSPACLEKKSLVFMLVILFQEGGGRRAGTEGKPSWRWGPELSFGASEGFARGRENGLREGMVRVGPG